MYNVFMQEAQRADRNGEGSGMGEGERDVNTLLGDTQGAVMGGVVNSELGAEDVIIEKTLLSIQEKVCLAQGYIDMYIDSCLLDKILATCYIHVHVHVATCYIHVHLGVLCCFALFVCLTLLASFFLPSHLSFKNMYMYIHVHVHVAMTHNRKHESIY